MIDYNKYIGKKFSEYNCYDLFRAIQAELGHDLPDYSRGTPRENAEQVEMELLARYKRLEQAVYGCAVIMYDSGYPSHVATYIGEGRIIHSTAATGVIISDLSLEQVEGFYGVRE